MYVYGMYCTDVVIESSWREYPHRKLGYGKQRRGLEYFALGREVLFG